MMHCDDMETRLNDYVDGLLDEAAVRGVDEHVASCVVCRAELEALRALQEEVRGLPSRIEPSRDLWDGILDRIEEAEPENVVSFASFSRRVLPQLTMAAAAAAVVVLGLVLSRAALDRMAPEAAAPVVAEKDIQKFENEYLQARDELRGALEEKKADLSPEMLAVVEENLAVIENAVVDISRAMANNPNHEGLERKLHAAYQHEMTFLRQAVQMDDDV